MRGHPLLQGNSDFGITHHRRRDTAIFRPARAPQRQRGGGDVGSDAPGRCAAEAEEGREGAPRIPRMARFAGHFTDADARSNRNAVDGQDL